MDWFSSIQRFYPNYWTKNMVKDAVVKGKITEAEYEEIVKEPYETA